jgi:hypothetical protein
MDRTEVLAQLHAAARVVLLVLVLRAFPVLVAFFAAEAARVAQRALAVAVYTLLAAVAVAYAGFGAIDLVATYAYFAAVVVVPYAVSVATSRRDVLFGAAFVVFMLAPALFGLRLRATMLCLGWEFMLAAYSYGVSAPARRSFAGYASFVFTNPALVYSHRGVSIGPPSLDRRGFVRVLEGGGRLFASELLPFVSSLLFGEEPPGALRALASLFVIARFYAAHTGLASIQIGLCRQLGLELPERYVKPYRAASPREFWRRWNTYVGLWIGTYVFRPLALYAGRRWRLRGRRLSVLSVLVSFACAGILHDLGPSLYHHELRHWGVLWFTANGIVLILWELVARTTAWSARHPVWSAIGPRALVLVIAIAMAGAIP